MKSDKLCPLKRDEGHDVKELFYKCDGAMCQWWTSAYTIEGIEVFDCALVIMAKKNADGKIPV